MKITFNVCTSVSSMLATHNIDLDRVCQAVEAELNKGTEFKEKLGNTTLRKSHAETGVSFKLRNAKTTPMEFKSWCEIIAKAQKLSGIIEIANLPPEYESWLKKFANVPQPVPQP